MVRRLRFIKHYLGGWTVWGLKSLKAVRVVCNTLAFCCVLRVTHRNYVAVFSNLLVRVTAFSPGIAAWVTRLVKHDRTKARMQLFRETGRGVLDLVARC